jgi:hypothetical protein
MRRLFVMAAALAALAALPQDASAQVRFGVGGGPVFPLGDFGDAVNTGLHGGLALELGLPIIPVGVRADLMLQRFGGVGDIGDMTEVFGTINGRFGLLPLPLVSAYLTAGGGLYSSTWDPTPGVDSERVTDFGINAGVGGSVNLLVIRPFVEARFHRVLGDNARSFIPILVGVYF